MTPGIRALIVTAIVGCSWSSAVPALAQDLPADVQAIRKMLEQQNDQIARLSAEVARLSALIEGPRRSETAPPPATMAVPSAPVASAPAAEPVRPAVMPPTQVHVVVKGDSLDKIAKAHGITAQELQKFNKISDPKKLQIGQSLNLPPNATPAVTPAVPATPAAPAAPATPATPTEKKEP